MLPLMSRLAPTPYVLHSHGTSGPTPRLLHEVVTCAPTPWLLQEVNHRSVWLTR
jgi:hypothetical protein